MHSRARGPMLVAAALVFGACTAPPTETEVRLATQVVRQDFGSTMGTLPVVPCNAQLNPCNALPVPDSRLKVTCDLSRMQCIGDLSVVVLYTLDLSQDAAFRAGLAQQSADSVRTIILSYGLSNTLTFSIPETEVHVGPKDIRTPRDPGVVPVGRIGPFAAGKDVPDESLQLVIDDGSPAHAFLVDRIANPERPFSFLLATTVPFRGGDPIPAGRLEVRLTPIVRLLKR
ncbi:MAG: hypothetical protein NZ890_20280 [Myxococcota bacterium]|nr:hypothetical protein [Myxococcota bacterium]